MRQQSIYNNCVHILKHACQQSKCANSTERWHVPDKELKPEAAAAESSYVTMQLAYSFFCDFTNFPFDRAFPSIWKVKLNFDINIGITVQYKYYLFI